MVNISWLDTETQLMGMSAVTLNLAASALRNWIQAAISYGRSALEEADTKKLLMFFRHPTGITLLPAKQCQMRKCLG
jgi:hypothetical protein